MSDLGDDRAIAFRQIDLYRDLFERFNVAVASQVERDRHTVVTRVELEREGGGRQELQAGR